MNKITYELRRYTKTTGSVGERLITTNKLRDCTTWLANAISLNKYEVERHGWTWIILGSQLGKQNKMYRIFKIVEGK